MKELKKMEDLAGDELTEAGTQFNLEELVNHFGGQLVSRSMNFNQPIQPTTDIEIMCWKYMGNNERWPTDNFCDDVGDDNDGNDDGGKSATPPGKENLEKTDQPSKNPKGKTDRDTDEEEEEEEEREKRTGKRETTRKVAMMMTLSI